MQNKIDVEFKTKPYKHQLNAYNKFKDKEYFALFMDMGTGKTKTTLDIASYKYLNKQINAMLIIAPNNVHIQWVDEQVPLHLSVPHKDFIWYSNKKGNKYYNKLLNNFIAIPTDKLKVFVVNVEAFQSTRILETIKAYITQHKVFIVVDEATRIKNPNAKRSKVITRLNKYGHRAILTGTPTAKSPFDLWSQFNFLKSNYFDVNYFIFQHRYGILMKGSNYKTGIKYTSLIDEKTFNIIKHKINILKKQRTLTEKDYEAFSVIYGISEKSIRFIEHQTHYTKYKKLDELKELISKDVFAIRKEDCLDLPPKVYEHIYVDMSKEQKRIYNNLKTEYLVKYESKELSLQNKITLTLRLMQVCGGFFPYKEDDVTKNILIDNKSMKLETLKTDIEELGNEQIIIWAHFVAELKLIYEELKKDYKCELYYGKTQQLTRKKIIKDFQDKKFQIFIGNPATAAFGLNLQTAHNQYFYSNSYRVEDRLQAEDRSHRIGMTSPCVYKDIIIKNSIDEKVYKAIISGRNLNDYFKDNSLRSIFNDDQN